ncbi:hypothetical protein D3C79_1002820 [compost metagenome]
MNPFSSTTDNHYHFGFMILIRLTFLTDKSLVEAIRLRIGGAKQGKDGGGRRGAFSP